MLWNTMLSFPWHIYILLFFPSFQKSCQSIPFSSHIFIVSVKYPNTASIHTYILLSSYPGNGISIPQFKSLVTALSFNPCFKYFHVSFLAFILHVFSTSFVCSSISFWNADNFKYNTLLFLFISFDPHTIHFPSSNSSVVGTCKQLSHWSPFVSSPHSGHINFMSLSCKNFSHFGQYACSSIFSYIYPFLYNFKNSSFTFSSWYGSYVLLYRSYEKFNLLNISVNSSWYFCAISFGSIPSFLALSVIGVPCVSEPDTYNTLSPFSL